MNYTKNILAAALCAAATVVPAFAEDEGIALPDVSVGFDYCSKQISRGLADNKEGIVTAIGALEWEGFSFEVDGLFNTTDIMEEDGYDNWDNTEVDYVLGYGYTFGADDFGLPTDIELGLDYTYEWDNGGDGGEDDHVQYIHASFGLPEVFLSPTIGCEWMLDQFHGQYYTLELSHSFDLVAGEGEDADPVVALTLGFVQGLADKKYNEDDLGKDFWAFRETTFQATIDWAVCDFLTVSPYIAYSDHYAGPVRNAAKDYGMQEGDTYAIYGGVAVTASF